MANLKEVRERISSVVTTQQITKAMKLVAASKLKRAQDSITQMRPYSQVLSNMLENVMANLDGVELELGLNRSVDNPKRGLLIVMTSDRGLCGAFNANLMKQAKEVMASNSDIRYDILPVGKKAYEFAQREEVEVIDSYWTSFGNIEFEGAAAIAEFAIKGFSDGTYDEVKVVFSEFVNAATQKIEAVQYLPVSMDSEESDDASSTSADYIFEPNQAELLDILIPKILRTTMFRFMLDTNASEHGARMVAMEQATENANELLRDLKLQYNRERQAAITNEILEIVGGAAALEEG
ncbi:MAG: ATP synthase F1 subunit gamma [Bacteroidota bacterium]|nr:ATP synthase F1 subunit gamma [Bacteroidota bacterium]MEC8032698.1 ATP synthase F1 subunit gamma [Bacteroidota bacterium]MEC8757660.1 ATP synthase F1 subunit gamma [Bacteroidota bacterium]|tara:strand:+ start:210 stop:1091 length:882 start_codon:yes stop_codon:yes gene_type:complete